MTNKPMLSVERELIQRIADHCKFWVDHPYLEAIADVEVELRALLDKPVVEGEVERLERRCKNAELALKVQTENCEALKAAQHQGEPLMIQAVAVTRDDDDEGLVLEWLLEGGISEMEFAGMTLFALPEANELCDEDGSAEIYLSPQSFEKPAPVAVVMPERETYTKYLVGVIPHNANEVNAYKDGWNTCLEEVSRLNGVKP